MHVNTVKLSEFVRALKNDHNFEYFKKEQDSKIGFLFSGKKDSLQEWP